MNRTVVGKKVSLVDASAKVTGTAIYGRDVKRLNMLAAKVLRSTVPHALIRRLDISRAEKLPGVRAVLTAKDFPDHAHGFLLKDRPILAQDRVRFVGEALAVVAAEDEQTAEEALELIEVEYEELPAIFDAEEALKPAASKLHPHLESYEALWPAIRHGNVCAETRLRRGDVATAFAEADLVLEGTYRTPMVHHGYLEPHATVAEVDPTGRITIWSPTQRAFGVRADVAEALQMPLNKVHVMGTYVGGAFGGKEEAALEIYCAALARKTERPVAIVQSRSEDFISNTCRHAAIVHVKTGVKGDGTILARQVDMTFDTGAYCEAAPAVLAKAVNMVIGPYRVPNVLVEGRCVYTNKLPAGAVRGIGIAQAAFASESQMDEVAQALGMDPWELRWRNAVEEGDIWPSGQELTSVGYKETLAKIKPYWDEAKARRQPPYGVGLVSTMYQTGGFPGSAEVRLNEDGTAIVATGAIDVGTGSKTTLAQIVAEELGLPLDDITVVMSDTDATPYDRLTAASRIAYVIGAAVLGAARDAKRQLLEEAAHKLGTTTDSLECSDRRIFLRESPEVGVGLQAVARQRALVRMEPIVGRWARRAEEPPYDANAIQGSALPTILAPGFVTLIAEVDVDDATGQVTARRLVVAEDVGYALNPLVVQGQIEGAMAQGLGFALFEEMAVTDGKVLNPNLLDYRMATAADAPQTEVLIVEATAPLGPYGAKGVGEVALVPVAPAVANAVYDAVGVRIQELPLTPQRVLLALKERRQDQRAPK
ncbi:MAG: xanthine dehydrogenase family protein molybdopterin-binding subunit [Dehalococcoidia bacterium]